MSTYGPKLPLRPATAVAASAVKRTPQVSVAAAANDAKRKSSKSSNTVACCAHGLILGAPGLPVIARRLSAMELIRTVATAGPVRRQGQYQPCQTRLAKSHSSLHRPTRAP